MKLAKKLSPAVIEAAKPESAPYRLWDTVVPQLHIRVQPSGVKSWNVQWSRTRSKSLGKWPGVTVEAARSRAKSNLMEAEDHGKPLSVIEAEKPLQDKPITLKGFIENHYAPQALTHQKAGKATLESLRSVWGSLYEKELSQILALDIERVKSSRLKAGRKPATVNRDLDRIRSVLSKAVEWAFLSGHPLKSVKRVKGADSDRIRYLSDDEGRRLRKALEEREMDRRAQRESGNAWSMERGRNGLPAWPEWGYTDHLMPIVILALNTGLRRGELLSLDWDHVSISGAVLTVTAGSAKSGKSRHIPLNTEALETLKRWHRQHGGKGLVFPGSNGARMWHINSSWETLMESAKLKNFRFHDLRHDFASKLVMVGVDLNTVRELLGHGDLKMTLRYAHLSPQKLADAVAKLGAR